MERKVEMIGFRSEEPHVIEALEETFAFYYDHIRQTDSGEEDKGTQDAQEEHTPGNSVG